MPTDYPRPAFGSGNGASHHFRLPLDLLASVRHLAQKQDATPYMVLLAAFDALMYRYSGQEIFNVGSPIANRQRAEIEPLIGLFVNTLVLKPI